jgi:hypothetical protein
VANRANCADVRAEGNGAPEIQARERRSTRVVGCVDLCGEGRAHSIALLGRPVAWWAIVLPRGAAIL